MKTYHVKWSSPKNYPTNTDVIVRAVNLVDAQDKFFAWLKTHPVYQHMWNLNMEITEVEYASPEVIE
jgi:2-hydroxychromene-2-carboxylate isomerase